MIYRALPRSASFAYPDNPGIAVDDIYHDTEASVGAREF
jgi:hypothetical protein